MVTIKIDEDTLLDLFNERVSHWTDDEDTVELFSQMYESYIDNGLYEGAEIDIMEIVDNDYVNYCKVIYDDDERYAEISEYFKREGCGDCSCEIEGIGFIEAEYDGKFLIRY